MLLNLLTIPTLSLLTSNTSSTPLYEQDGQQRAAGKRTGQRVQCMDGEGQVGLHASEDRGDPQDARSAKHVLGLLLGEDSVLQVVLGGTGGTGKRTHERELVQGAHVRTGLRSPSTSSAQTYLVKESVTGLARYLRDQGTRDQGVVVTYDARTLSLECKQLQVVLVKRIADSLASFSCSHCGWRPSSLAHQGLHFQDARRVSTMLLYGQGHERCRWHCLLVRSPGG